MTDNTREGAQAVAAKAPTGIVSPHVDDYCWAASGWEDAGEGSVCDARTTTRGQAAAFFARAFGSITDVRVWKRYVLRFTRQDVWDGPGKDRWVDRREAEIMAARALEGRPGEDIPPLGDLFKEASAEPPTDWEPDCYDPVWQFVHGSHPDAVPVWICGIKGDTPPADPSKKRRPDASTARECRP